jgi:hypothetical protein
MGLKENVIIGKLIPARAEIDLPPPPVKEIPIPEMLELEEGDDLFGDDDEVAGLLGALSLEEPDDLPEPGEEDDDLSADDISEPTREDLLDEDADEPVLDIEADVPAAPELPKGFVAEPDE